MVARARSDRKDLKRELAAVKAEEQRASTWLVRISLFLLVFGWAYSEYASNTSITPRTRTATSARIQKQAVTAGTADLKPFLLASGAALGGVRLLLRFYFMRRAKVIEESLLSDGSAGREDEARKRRSRS